MMDNVGLQLMGMLMIIGPACIWFGTKLNKNVK